MVEFLICPRIDEDQAFGDAAVGDCLPYLFGDIDQASAGGKVEVKFLAV
jgi:hypothetical protein